MMRESGTLAFALMHRPRSSVILWQGCSSWDADTIANALQVPLHARMPPSSRYVESSPFALQWAAYFGRAVVKLDHSCAHPVPRCRRGSFTLDSQFPPKTDGCLR